MKTPRRDRQADASLDNMARDTRRNDRAIAATADSAAMPDDEELAGVNLITSRIIGCAIEVHRVLGPGLLEPTYETALCIEFDDAGMNYDRQVRIPAVYRGRALGEYRIDFIVEGAVAQILTYMRVTEREVGLLINFNSRLVTEGVKRFAL